ncbi:diacylglycerol O-acyltransferase 1 [Entomophthora muscae]|uniref:Diacylglycerol O-acyltransferase 1 n=1 Tax=Entomophthora muscae TaxID=34485 RepID=A0ACC2RM18_9FUNG|nr:diacylglycerol O-acyltransferase 1 [Entomophthora muscae]
MGEYFGFQFAPLNTPFQRRLEMIAIIIMFTIIFQCLMIPFIILKYPDVWPVGILYFTYLYFDKSYENGGRGSNFFRNMPFWKWLANYFPIKIHKEHKLDPKHSYVIGYHPHGIFTTGAMIGFGSEGAGVSEIFPDLKIHVLGLDLIFKVPIYRDLALWMGSCSVSKKSICNILKRGPGRAVIIVVGGAQEALLTKPELSDLVLVNRYGFVKLAIIHGSHLVPIFAFGENKIFDQAVLKEGTVGKYIQDGIKKHLGFSTPFFTVEMCSCITVGHCHTVDPLT